MVFIRLLNNPCHLRRDELRIGTVTDAGYLILATASPSIGGLEVGCLIFDVGHLRAKAFEVER